MNDNTSNDLLNQSLDDLQGELRQIEQQLLPQLDEIAEKIPEVYAGYANMVHTIVDTALEIGKPSGRAACAMMIAAEIGERSIMAYGQYKAAKEHNRMLKKYMEVKTTLASNNLEKVTYLLPKITLKSGSTAKLLERCAEMTYNLADLNAEKIDRVASIQHRALAMHRTSLFLYELCKYLKNEYTVWLRGEQCSNYDMPDYYLINSMLAQTMYGENLLEAYNQAADCNTTLSGKQIMLLSDIQLTLMALGDRICKVDTTKAHPIVARLTYNCGGVEKYSEITKEYLNHISRKPKTVITYLGLLACAAIIYIVYFYADTSNGVRLIMLATGLAAVLRICFKGGKKATTAYVMLADEYGNKANKEIETLCGKVERPDIDYQERNALSEAINGFFNIK